MPLTALPHTDVAVIGSGFAGLGMAIALKRAGRDDFAVLERADALGGTWRANNYPGCACDVPAPFYSFSFAPNSDWSRLYAPHHEIRAYLEACADRFDVRSHLKLNATVTAATWDDEAQRWTLAIDGSPALTARAVVGAPGGLSRPSFPDLEGLGDFAGPWFHSAEWDHDVELAGARVAVIGTGASAIQLVPRIARDAAHVDVFQRTPPWVLPKADRHISGAEKWLFANVPATQKLLRGAVWAMQEWMGVGNTVDQRLTGPLERLGRFWINRSVRDPALRERLTPDYVIGCKRLLLSNDWYPALAQDHVAVVSESIARVGPRGVVTADGTEHPADVIVFGTGFHTTDPLGQLTIRGRDGLDLADAWRGGMQAHRGTTIAGFPNFFIVPGPNTGTGHTSQVHMIENQLRHVLAALQRTEDRGAVAIEPHVEAQAAFNAAVQRRMGRTVWLRGGCSSWYIDAHGRNTTLWPGSTPAFRRALASIDDREFAFEMPRVPAPQRRAAHVR